ncbi:hypothetical protein WA158_008482 [Blastocystis sp. Blastoise]
MTVGSPSQTVDVLLDTRTPNFFLFSSLCANCNSQKLYNVTRSKTSQIITMSDSKCLAQSCDASLCSGECIENSTLCRESSQSNNCGIYLYYNSILGQGMISRDYFSISTLSGYSDYFKGDVKLLNIYDGSIPSYHGIYGLLYSPSSLSPNTFSLPSTIIPESSSLSSRYFNSSSFSLYTTTSITSCTPSCIQPLYNTILDNLAMSSTYTVYTIIDNVKHDNNNQNKTIIMKKTDDNKILKNTKYNNNNNNNNKISLYTTSNKVFSLCFGDTNGILSIGDLDTSLSSGSITWISMDPTSEYYALLVTDMKISDDSILKGSLAFSIRFDTTVPYIYLPSSVYYSFQSYIQQHYCNYEGFCGTPNLFSNVCVPYIPHNRWPVLVFYFGETFVSLPPELYLYQESIYNVTYNCLGIKKQQDIDMPVFGTLFLRGFTISIDSISRKIGLAKQTSKCDALFHGGINEIIVSPTVYIDYLLYIYIGIGIFVFLFIALIGISIFLAMSKKKQLVTESVHHKSIRLSKRNLKQITI